MRHGPSEPRDPTRWPDDTERPLTARGEAEIRRSARELARLLPSPARMASSAADRALTTARLVAQALPEAPEVETWPELSPGRLPEPVFRRVRRAARPGRGLLLFGHAPTVAEVLGLALTGRELEEVHLTKGGAACIDFPAGVRPGTGRLVWRYTLAELAGGRKQGATP